MHHTFELPDTFNWWWDPEGFLVKAAYSRILFIFLTSSVHNSIPSCVFLKIWKFFVPSSIRFIAWRLLLHRLLTRLELCKRGIINGPHNIVCPLCFNDEDMVALLFLHYIVASQIWTGSINWMGIHVFPLLAKNLDNFVFFDSILWGRIKKRYQRLLRFAVNWSIWLSRNSILFKEKHLVIDYVITLVKFLSWDCLELAIVVILRSLLRIEVIILSFVFIEYAHA